VKRDQVVLILGGRRYVWIGPGFGAQLESFEWRRPAAGTTRTLAGVRFTVFQTHRVGLRVRASWGVSGHGNIDDQSRRIREARSALFGC
jgi:hypothetical protein